MKNQARVLERISEHVREGVEQYVETNPVFIVDRKNVGDKDERENKPGRG